MSLLINTEEMCPPPSTAAAVLLQMFFASPLSLCSDTEVLSAREAVCSPVYAVSLVTSGVTAPTVFPVKCREFVFD